MTQSNIDIHRIHGFDAMRAIMMMLGLVLHAAMTYSDIDYGNVWPLKDATNTSHAFHLLIEFIHVFRMPAFFVIAGFFGALLFYKKGPKEMISNRLNRIVYPFFVALLILWPLAVFTFTFANHMMPGSDNSLGLVLKTVFPSDLIPQNTIHLWFLYYLALISFATCFIALALKGSNYCDSKRRKWFEYTHKNIFIVIIPLSILTFITLYYMGSSSAITSSGFIPDIKTFLFYSVFYVYGWVLYLSKQLISKFTQHAWLMLFLGTVMFIIYLYLGNVEGNSNIYFAMIANSLACWLYIFSAMGLFLLYASSGSFFLRYISDSAYWVYLIHLPLIAFFAGLLAEYNISAYLKFLIVLCSATAICFITYHYFVRDTFIGLFLNGRKYPKRTDIK